MSEQKGQSVHFNKLNNKEKESKLLQLLNGSKSQVTVWEKGKSQKSICHIQGPLSTKFDVFVSEQSELQDLLDKDVLVAFSLSGLNFFAQAKCYADSKGTFIRFEGDFFKSERRTNFRLLTDPHHDVYIHVFLKAETEDELSNVISFNAKTSETGLFKNFLALLNSESDEFSEEGFIKIKVLDLSASGAALQLGEMEKELFEKLNSTLGKMFLDFNGKVIEVPGAKIHYINPLKSKSQKTNVYKAGIEFIDVDTNFDVEISKMLNKVLRDVDKEFEDFLS